MANLPVPTTVPAEWYADVPRSVTRHVTFGLVLILVAFGGFGLWAFKAPLAAAVITPGSFVATGKNKVVQHLEGGIIKEILVSEGDKVSAGQPIVLLDETSAMANERELFLRQVRLEAIEARLLAQYERKPRPDFPRHLLDLRSDFEVAAILDGQTVAFNSDRQGLENDTALILQNIEALKVRSIGYDRQLSAVQMQNEILKEDMASKQTLLDKGLVRRTEVNALRRALAETEGQMGRIDAEMREIEEISKKYTAQIEQTNSEYRNAALDELQVVQAELDGIREQMRKAHNILQRVEVLAPVSGTVVRLYYHTSGGVIESGKAIAEILPADEPLIIEVQVPRNEIDSVQQGLPATVRLIALNQRTTPVLQGQVFYVSADAIVDSSQDRPQEIYIARISVAPDEMGRVRGFSPTPGMPVEIMIQTEERTFFQYLTKPITDSMTRAFREQ
ncbi:HlyD family type I secretion periplasmic adaptor subunit [Sulfitobacter sabulilitoris]|uniref:Membrane fusion protein (MFP) family protein n=1 Tax=Sulfitobacter sabulilitoris TaxID=2562655 RepID=A0A5S3PK70_9RHOB|nr:HlyD family type I secretion periplasmic adaptor subunit [Sulfitobacter sabulilitoris]TMM54783.1 HlyD family type I secretion periplasmic adaptor subunit [Sulfitobacter sabulilitoris]